MTPKSIVAISAVLLLAGRSSARAQSPACAPDPMNPFATYCPDYVKAALQNGEIKAAPSEGSVSRQRPEPTTAAGLLLDRATSEVTDPIKEGIIRDVARKAPRIAAGLRFADRADTVAGVLGEPATALNLIKGPAFLAAGVGFIEASWPEEISPLQGTEGIEQRAALSEYAKQIDVVIDLVNRALADPSLDPSLRRALSNQIYFMQLERTRLRSLGVPSRSETRRDSGQTSSGARRSTQRPSTPVAPPRMPAITCANCASQ
jgi:hypothetical protein